MFNKDFFITVSVAVSLCFSAMLLSNAAVADVDPQFVFHSVFKPVLQSVRANNTTCQCVMGFQTSDNQYGPAYGNCSAVDKCSSDVCTYDFGNGVSYAGTNKCDCFGNGNCTGLWTITTQNQTSLYGTNGTCSEGGLCTVPGVPASPVSDISSTSSGCAKWTQ